MSAVLAAIGVMAAPATAQPTVGANKIEASVAKVLDASGSTDFYVEFAQQADLTAASQIQDWTQRGQAVVDALQRTANNSQGDVRKILDASGAQYTSYWVANTILVKGGSEALANSLAAQGSVTTLRAPRTYALPEPTVGTAEATVNAVEWGIAAINADDVWAPYGRGEGIVVANIDTGVDFDHPAVVGKYRGNLGGGTFDHNYNWFDPSSVCGSPSLAPCDNNNHGTHTMGTMVGDDGAGNQIGVAPGARWIAAKGCESNSCSDAALLGSGQWILAPTNLAGANPRADLRPHIVNNSWGGGGGDSWYQATVTAWRAAGIFPAFSNGNSGPGCTTSGSPGDYVNSYSSGAFDINGAIASFSSRGAAGSEVKPNLAAPGVNVRSSVNGGGYAAFNGTSMASPHTAGTVALMWSAAPSLVGDIAQTSTLLDDTATDTPNAQCGGTNDDNNVFGEGKLNALTAVEQSPRGPVGTLNGTVTNSATSAPVSGAQVVVDGPVDRTATTGAAGTFSFPLPVGTYTVTVSAFGFATNSGSVTITEGATTTRNVALNPVTSGAVSGVVSSASGPVANATVTINGTPLPPTTTAANGSYSFASVPFGTYTVTASAGGCFGSVTVPLVVDGNETLNITLPQRSDSFGYSCVIQAANYVEAPTRLALAGDDSSQAVPLPFAFNFYGTSYSTANVSTNGHLSFTASSTAFTNGAIPSTAVPNAAIYPFWDDFNFALGGGAFIGTTGTAPNRTFTIEWRDVRFFSTTGLAVDFQVQLNEDGSIVTGYRNLGPDPREFGNSATVGIENAAGTVALQYSFDTATLSNSQSIKFLPPPTGIVTGTVTDANDSQPVEGATVRALQGATVVGTTTTAANGTYSIRLLLGTYTIEIGKTNYVTNSGSVTLATANQVVTRNAALATSAVSASPDNLSFLGNEGQLRTAIVGLTNTSTSGVSLTYSLTDDSSWLWTVPATGTVAPGATRNLTVRVDAAGLEPGVHRGAILLTTNAGRTPSFEIPVTLVVPAYRQGVDVGSTSLYVDNAGDPWGADRAWTPGSYGYLGTGGLVNSSGSAIAGTDNDRIYQTQREQLAGYRFDNLPAGTYVVDLEFAELRSNLAVGRRVFDVYLNGQLVMLRYDPVAAVGTRAADHREFTVTVPAGGAIAVDLAPIRSQLPPTLNGIRVTHRPDLG